MATLKLKDSTINIFGTLAATDEAVVVHTVHLNDRNKVAAADNPQCIAMAPLTEPSHDGAKTEIEVAGISGTSENRYLRIKESSGEIEQIFRAAGLDKCLPKIVPERTLSERPSHELDKLRQ